MSLDHALRDAVRVAFVLGLALAAMPLLRRAPAATRRLVLALSLGGALLMPLASALAPAGRIPVRPTWSPCACCSRPAEGARGGPGHVCATKARARFRLKTRANAPIRSL